MEELSKRTLKATKETAKSDGGSHHTEVLEYMAQTLMSMHQRETLTVSQSARDSYTGSCIRATHRCFLTSKTPCCVTDPELEIPMRIGTLPLPVASSPMGTAVIEAQVVVGSVAVVPAYPAPPMIVQAEAIPLDGDECAITVVPPDWSGAIVAEVVVLPMGQAVVGGATVVGEATEEDIVVMGTTVLDQAPGTMGAPKEMMVTGVGFELLLSTLLCWP